MKKTLLLPMALLAATSVTAKDVKVCSPNANICVNINDNGGHLSYTTMLNGKALFTQKDLEVQLTTKTLGQNAKIGKVETKKVQHLLKPAIPIRQAVINDNYTEATLSMKGGYKVAFRVYDNAVAYRYILNEKDSVYVVNETFNLKPTQTMTAHYQPSWGWAGNTETAHQHCLLKDWHPTEDHAVLPVALSSTSDDLQMLISESDLRDYPGLYLDGNGDKDQLSGALVPFYEKWTLDGDRGTNVEKYAPYAAHTSGRRALPWRYVVIGDSKTLLEQTITAQLSGKCEIEDTSWIVPGQVSWDWWNHKMLYGPDVNFIPGCNTDTYKYYIDFASKNGIKYIIMDEGWAKDTFSPFTPNADLNLQECISYGKERGVGIILWLTWSCVERYMDTIFDTYEKWGVVGAKIDFMDRQDQWMINWYERTIKEAAKHHIMVDFHGAMKPAGLEHRYPNLLAYEGVRGLEQMGGCDPSNTIYIPFTRGAVGPTDFTPGAMINHQPEEYVSNDPNCAAKGTRAYSMALFTIMETATQMLADSPTQYYKNQECTDFLTQIPVTWDETRAIDAKMGEYVVVAKRKGNKWFVAGITNQKERNIKLSLDFLGEGKHTMTMFYDGPNANRQAMDYRKSVGTYDSSMELEIGMARNGGFTAIIE